MRYKSFPLSAILAAALFFLIVWTAYASVTLSSFTLTPESGLVRLDWKTGSELDFAGFFVRRSQVDDVNYSQWEQIEVEDAETGDLQTFVPARDDFGAFYPFIDRNVQNGSLYCYALEAVNSDQSVEYFPSEPACTTPGQTPTPTVSPTSTPAATGTATPTVAATNTPSGPTPTVTRTRLPSRTPAPTRTLTPIPSITPTPTNTPTVTLTPTFTPFPTFLPTWTNTPTATLTPSRTPQPSHTPGPLLASTLSPGGPANFLAKLGGLNRLTLGELILALASAIALLGGLLFAALYFLVLRSPEQ